MAPFRACGFTLVALLLSFCGSSTDGRVLKNNTRTEASRVSCTARDMEEWHVQVWLGPLLGWLVCFLVDRPERTSIRPVDYLTHTTPIYCTPSSFVPLSTLSVSLHHTTATRPVECEGFYLSSSGDCQFRCRHG